MLEIGTGSGYQAAVLAEIVKEVYSIEIRKGLEKKASELLAELGYNNVKTKYGDGYFGWQEHAPFDAVIICCHSRDPLGGNPGFLLGGCRRKVNKLLESDFDSFEKEQS